MIRRLCGVALLAALLLLAPGVAQATTTPTVSAALFADLAADGTVTVYLTASCEPVGDFTTAKLTAVLTQQDTTQMTARPVGCDGTGQALPVAFTVSDADAFARGAARLDARLSAPTGVAETSSELVVIRRT